MADQALGGSISIGVASAEQLGAGGAAEAITPLVGLAGIPSGETFPPKTGVFVDPVSVPTSMTVAY